MGSSGKPRKNPVEDFRPCGILSAVSEYPHRNSGINPTYRQFLHPHNAHPNFSAIYLFPVFTDYPRISHGKTTIRFHFILSSVGCLRFSEMPNAPSHYLPVEFEDALVVSLLQVYSVRVTCPNHCNLFWSMFSHIITSSIFLILRVPLSDTSLHSFLIILL